MPAKRVAIATCVEYPDPDAETGLLAGVLAGLGVDVSLAPWSEQPPGGWESFDAVIIRATWDYTYACERFVAWARAIGARLCNAPDVVAWNVDKRYLFDLERAGIAAHAGALLQPGTAFEPPPGRFVVKPTVSAGARDAAVYDEARHDVARAHVAALHAAGRDVLVQPYCARVEIEGETAVIVIDGELSHCMRKGALLELDQDPREGLYRPEHMRRREPEAEVVALAERAVGYVT
ncbi:MAG: hypothetical protein QOG42_1316, partial [Solirubrobacteraceae bacterium]|nr:hypothetical protein [Solirubrobacteraceae bacterium]